MASRVYSASEITAKNSAMLDQHPKFCRGIPAILHALPCVAAAVASDPIAAPAMSFLALVLIRLRIR